MSCVVGARTVSQLKQNIAWLEQGVPEEFWIALRNEGLVADTAPLPNRKM
jgi:D-threo-aldose 1-dehydrogenase